jgi:hypothetical protein
VFVKVHQSTLLGHLTIMASKMPPLDIAFWSIVLMVRTGWFDVLNEAAFALERVEDHPLPKQLHSGDRAREIENERRSRLGGPGWICARAARYCRPPGVELTQDHPGSKTVLNLKPETSG